jgi:flagellar basal body-associated protein FliL
MMDQMMGGRMMWGMGLIGLLVIIVLLLAAAALIKYLFFSKNEIAEGLAELPHIASLEQRRRQSDIHDELLRKHNIIVQFIRYIL